MKLFIVDKDKKFDNDFFNVVKEKLLDLYYEKVNVEKLLPFEEYINELPKYKSLLKNYIYATEICQIAFYNVVMLRFGDNITIKIDEKVRLPNTNIKLIDLCKLINNGNLKLQAYPIFTEIFDEAKKNIEKYYIEYALKENN